MADTIIHIGDVGTVIRLTVIEDDGKTPVNVSEATVKKFYFRKPNGVKFNKPAEFDSDGTDGKLKYVTLENDIDVTGRWEVQARIEIGTAKYYSIKTTFIVHENLA